MFLKDILKEYYFWKGNGWNRVYNKSSFGEYWDIAKIFNLFFYCSVKCFKLSYWAHHVQSLMQIDSVPIHFIPVFYLFVSYWAISDARYSFLLLDFIFYLFNSPLGSLLDVLSSNKLYLNKCYIFGIVMVSNHEAGRKIYLYVFHKGIRKETD